MAHGSSYIPCHACVRLVPCTRRAWWCLLGMAHVSCPFLTFVVFAYVSALFCTFAVNAARDSFCWRETASLKNQNCRMRLESAIETSSRNKMNSKLEQKNPNMLFWTIHSYKKERICWCHGNEKNNLLVFVFFAAGSFLFFYSVRRWHCYICNKYL